MKISLVSMEPYQHGKAISIKVRIKHTSNISPEVVSFGSKIIRNSGTSKYLSLKIGTHWDEFKPFCESFRVKFRRNPPEFLNYIQSPEFTSELQKIFDAYMNIKKSGALERAAFLSKKKMWSRRVKKLLSEALSAGVTKDEVSDLIDIILTKEILES